MLKYSSLAIVGAVQLRREPLLANAAHFCTKSPFGDYCTTVDHPTDYFVPNFGVDRDIKLTAMNLAKAEKEVGHTMSASFDAPAPLPDNRMPDLGLDADILTS